MSLRVLPEAEVIRVFGDPVPFLHSDGVPTAAWERHILAMATLPAPLPLAWDRKIQVRQIRVHEKLVRIFTDVLDACFNQPEVWKSINDYGGAYAWRTQRRAKARSRHCWAIAIDLDVGDNPFGARPQVHPKLVETFEAHGFAWGGRFPRGRQDGMHFELADLSKLG